MNTLKEIAQRIRAASKPSKPAKRKVTKDQAQKIAQALQDVFTTNFVGESDDAPTDKMDQIDWACSMIDDHYNFRQLDLEGDDLAAFRDFVRMRVSNDKDVEKLYQVQYL